MHMRILLHTAGKAPSEYSVPLKQYFPTRGFILAQTHKTQQAPRASIAQEPLKRLLMRRQSGRGHEEDLNKTVCHIASKLTGLRVSMYNIFGFSGFRRRSSKRFEGV